MIKTQGIYKSYNGLSVLKSLDFSAEKGEFAVITGASGCGKSTLLNVLSCLDNFDGGTLYLYGKCVNSLKRRELYSLRRNDIGFIFQGYNLISTMTALENVELPLKYNHKSYFSRKFVAEKALETVGLAEKLYSTPHQLSGGQQQRVAVARAIVTKPKILFFDEPTGNLDADSAQLVLSQITALKNQGTCVVMITHDRHLPAAADTAYRLKDGKLYLM